jgi:E3 ubiquitin-protein ligase SHPRH
MPRAKRNQKHQKGQPRPLSEAENTDAFISFLQSMSPDDDTINQQDESTRPTKRPRSRPSEDFICIARQNLTLTCSKPQTFRDALTFTRKNVGDGIQLKVISDMSKSSDRGTWRLELSSRGKSLNPGFAIYPELNLSQVSDATETALRVAEVQSTDPGYDGCIWAPVDISVRQLGYRLELDLSVRVLWTQNTTVWGNEKMRSATQQNLRQIVFKTWYPDLNPRGPLEWSPQDFYGAACVPTAEILGSELDALYIPDLEARLYPFQCRAVQWLLQREGVKVTQTPDDELVIQPYSAASLDPPVSFSRITDADGREFYVSPSLGAATKDAAIFQGFRDFRGGILAEEMGLGKTLEVIALILLHQRSKEPPQVFDSFLGRPIIPTAATLIVAPSPLLDQWLSELNNHAPRLKTLFYPGIKKFEKLHKGSNESPVEILARQDVVLTTYEVLRNEIWAASDAPTRSMRKERQYERVTSPLTQLSWWRVCIDEAQMVENWTNNAAQLARKIPRINAWAVTGTPVKDDVQKGKDTSSRCDQQLMLIQYRRPSWPPALPTLRAICFRHESLEYAQHSRQEGLPPDLQPHLDAPQQEHGEE